MAAARDRLTLLEHAQAIGPEGEQRRVHTALLRETRRLAEREQGAIAAGWSPFEPAAGWFSGYVEDPRFLHGRIRLASVIATAPIATAAGAGLALRWDALPAALATIVLLLGLQASLHGILGRIGEERDARITALRVFNAPMPGHALTAYKQARQSGLFDTFVVCSPREEDFRSIQASQAPSLGLLDPVLIGYVGEQGFLIAQWDLAQDMARL